MPYCASYDGDSGKPIHLKCSRGISTISWEWVGGSAQHKMVKTNMEPQQSISKVRQTSVRTHLKWQIS